MPDVTQPFEIQTDASDFPIGGVLLQGDHPVDLHLARILTLERTERYLLDC